MPIAVVENIRLVASAVPLPGNSSLVASLCSVYVQGTGCGSSTAASVCASGGPEPLLSPHAMKSKGKNRKARMVRSYHEGHANRPQRLVSCEKVHERLVEPGRVLPHREVARVLEDGEASVRDQ